MGEEPDDRDIAKGVDQFYTRVCLSEPHSTDWDLAKQRNSERPGSFEDAARGRRKNRKKPRPAEHQRTSTASFRSQSAVPFAFGLPFFSALFSSQPFQAS